MVGSSQSGRYYLILLPPEERRLSIRYYDERYSSLSIASNPIYVGNREKILDRLDREKKLTSSLSGAFLFSVLFSVSMFLMKRSEKYLLFYAIHALIPQLLPISRFFRPGTRRFFRAEMRSQIFWACRRWQVS